LSDCAATVLAYAEKEYDCPGVAGIIGPVFEPMSTPQPLVFAAESVTAA